MRYRGCWADEQVEGCLGFLSDRILYFAHFRRAGRQVQVGPCSFNGDRNTERLVSGSLEMCGQLLRLDNPFQVLEVDGLLVMLTD